MSAAEKQELLPEKKVVPKKRESVRVTVDLHPDLDEAIEEIASREHTSKSEVVRRALALMKVTNDAKRKGQSLGIVDDDGKQIVRIYGL